MAGHRDIGGRSSSSTAKLSDNRHPQLGISAASSKTSKVDSDRKSRNFLFGGVSLTKDSILLTLLTLDRAIRTYFGYGVSYRGVRKSNHMIVHSNDPGAPPQPLQAEEPRRGANGVLTESGMKVPPIAVQMSELGAVLNPMSRVDLYRVSTIKHDTPLRDIGRVRLQSRWVLQYNFWTVQLENTHQTDPRYANLWTQHQQAVQRPPAPVDSVTDYIGASGTGEDEDDEDESDSSSEDDD